MLNSRLVIVFVMSLDMDVWVVFLVWMSCLIVKVVVSMGVKVSWMLMNWVVVGKVVEFVFSSVMSGFSSSSVIVLMMMLVMIEF